MSVFRFEATPTTSRPVSRRMKGKSKDTRSPVFAFSTSPSLLQDITLDKIVKAHNPLPKSASTLRKTTSSTTGNGTSTIMDLPESTNDIEDSYDSSSDIAKADYAEESQAESGSDSQMEYSEVGVRTTASSGLTMKEYEEQLKKLTAENFNLKLKVYFVEERLSKVTGISDKEDLIKKNIQLKVTCESQAKELEKKQELLFEASKAFELLQKEHAEEINKLTSEKDKEIAELEEKLACLETTYGDLKTRFPKLGNLNALDNDIKVAEDFEKQIQDLENRIREEEEKSKELDNMLKDNQLELESYQMKSQRLENELEQRVQKIDELVEELEQKERDLASANFRIRKLEDEIKSKQREDEIMRERIEEKNKTIESLKNSLSTRDESIETLENRVAKERSSFQSLQSKIDGLSFQNSRLKEELEILQSRLKRTTENFSPRGKSRQVDEEYKQKYEDVMRMMEEQEAKHAKQLKDLEDKIFEKDAEAEDYQELFEKHKKLEDDHRKACTALKNFIRRSSDDKKEREALNHLLSSNEETIANLKAQLEQYRNKSLIGLSQEEKLSLAETGDNDRKFRCAAADKDSCCHEKDSEMKITLEQAEKEVHLEESEKSVAVCACGMEAKLEKIAGLEAEVVFLKNQIEEGDNAEFEPSENQARQLLLKELETKKSEIEKLHGELKKRNINLQEIVNKELWDKNRQIEKLENRLAELSEVNRALRAEIGDKDEKLKEVEKLNIASKKCESEKTLKEVPQCESKTVECLHVECLKAKEQADKTDAVRREAAEVCSLLAIRLEELAEFLDSLLMNSELLNGISYKKRQEIKQAMEKSRELSKHLSLSFSKKHLGDVSLKWNSFTTDSFSMSVEDSLSQNDSFGIHLSRDKVISEQTIIINKLREQLKLLTNEIKQRDIELSHCQGSFVLPLGNSQDNFSDQGIEGQSLSICQEISDYDECGEIEGAEKEKQDSEKVAISFVSEKKSNMQETSESEAWSEPDRSVSLARMGRLEEVPLCLSHRNSKCDDSSESSEETLNENPRSAGKRNRTSDLEIRRLQSKIKTLDELNENLCAEINLLKNGKADTNIASRLLKNEEANLMEKLRKTMDRLDECSLTCRQLEEKLAKALEKASSSAVEVSRAQEKISILEQEISQLKEEIAAKTVETTEKMQRILELEKNIEEIKYESEKKISEAVKQREAAEKRTLEVECKLKDAENMSKEVESRVNEIEKKITETKKFKKETVLHFKEAEKHVDTAEKMMEEAERIKLEAERKSKDFQNFIDLMRKEVEEKLKEAERKVKKSEKEKEELEKQVMKLKKRLMEAERNKSEVEAKVKEGKETIQCMEEKLKELEVAMDQCSEEAQRKIKEIQKKADARVAELEMKIEEREWIRKTEVEKKMVEAERLSKELEIGFRMQLEEAERKVKRARENAEATVKVVREEAEVGEKQELELRQKMSEIEAQKKEECSDLRRQLDEVRLEASELELELTKLTNEKIHLEEELKRMLDKQSALVKDNKEIKGRYESSIHELENKLTQLAVSKSHLASRLEDIESTNFDLVSRISAIRGKETMVVEHEYRALSPPCSPSNHGSLVSTILGDLEYGPELNGNKSFSRHPAVTDTGEQVLGIHLNEFTPLRRNMNSSPDLGIESDPGRFSSLEANQMQGDQLGVVENPEASEVKKLEFENAELRRRLVRTRQALEETLTQLSAANQRKKQVEKAICKQLHKTHHILKKARVNFESREGDSVE